MLCLIKIKALLSSVFSKLFWKKTPLANYIPKEATQQDQFLLKFPEFDGRGIKIAIIDFGVDVSLEGIQQTSEGLPKIIDCFDFTGAGDVDTSVILEANAKGILVGISGRKFKIPEKWINPSGEWHLGMKALYKLKKSRTKMPKNSAYKFKELDCIVWFDGTRWLACIDTVTNDLEKAKVLTNFRDDHNWGSMTLNGIEINYCITVHNDGDLLEIFTPFDDHGSLVAEVAAASYARQSNPDGEGMAPGAQIISINVMDPKNNFKVSMPALQKALLKCIELKMDIINYSISSFTADEDIESVAAQEIAILTNEMVTKYQILIFKSVGNDGPFYQTMLKCDRRIEDVIFRIGAILTPDIRKRIYNVSEENHPPVAFPFSSRGPRSKMDQGLEFMAPGAFISSSFQNKYAHGTSFSSPNAAGAVACLLSGLKACSIQYTYLTIKFGLFKTALLPENRNRFEFGNGIIQIDEAFDYCCKNDVINFKILSSSSAKGILFAENDQGQGVLNKDIDLSHFISIAPGEAAEAKWTLELSPLTAKRFIELSTKINQESLFNVQIFLNKLELGTPHFAEISIMDAKYGSIFAIPIMVDFMLLVTETQNFHIQKEIKLDYENPYYLYFHPIFENLNNKNKKCHIKIKIKDAVKNHATNLCLEYNIHGKNRTNFIEGRKTKKILKFSTKTQAGTYSFPLENFKVHEVCIYQQIGCSLSNANFILEMNFKNDKKK